MSGCFAALVLASSMASAAEPAPPVPQDQAPVATRYANGVGMKLGIGVIPYVTALFGPSFSIGLDYERALSSDGRVWLVASPTYLVNPYLTEALLPVGLEYDLPLPVTGLSLFGRLSAGAAVLIGLDYTTSPPSRPIAVVGLIEPEIGLRLALGDRWSVTLEPASVPITIGATGSATALLYRASLGVGVSF
jgi:hypothetical protein